MGKAVNYNDIVEIINSQIEVFNVIINGLNNPNNIRLFTGEQIHGVKNNVSLCKWIIRIYKIMCRDLDDPLLNKDYSNNIKHITHAFWLIGGFSTSLKHISKTAKYIRLVRIYKFLKHLPTIITAIQTLPKITFKGLISITALYTAFTAISSLALLFVVISPILLLANMSTKSFKLFTESLKSVVDAINGITKISSNVMIGIGVITVSIIALQFFGRQVRTFVKKVCPVIKEFLTELLTLFPNIDDSADTIKDIKKWSTIMDEYKVFVSAYRSVLLQFMWLGFLVQKTSAGKGVVKILNNISYMLNSVVSLFNSLNTQKLTNLIKIYIKLILIKKITKHVIILLRKLSHSFIYAWVSYKAIQIINKTMESLIDTIQIINKNKPRKDIIELINIYKKLIKLTTYITILGILSGTAIVAISITLLFLGGVLLFMKLLQLCFTKAIKTRQILSIVHGIKKVILIFASLMLMIESLIVLGIMSAIGIISIPLVAIFCGGLILICRLLQLLMNITGRLFGGGFLLNVLKLTLVLFIMQGVVITMIILGVLSIGAVVMIPAIAIFLLGLMMIIGLFIAVGYVASMLLPVIGVAILGLKSVLLLIGIMAAIAGALWLLSMISIDTDKVKENVKSILSTASEIVSDIFDNDTKDETKKSGDKTFGDVIVNMLGGTVKGILSIINLIVGIPYLLMIFIAITLILFIAIALRILQVIDLNPDKITENVGIVLDTATLIIDSIFSREQEDKTKTDGGDSTLGSWIVDHLGDMVKGIINVINIIIGVVYLFMIFMAVAMILFIVTTLRILQTIDLDPDKITENVGIVFETADQVIMSIFNSDKEDKKQPEKKDKPWYASLFDWVCDFGKSFLGGLGRIAGLLVSVPYLVLILTSVGLIWSIVSILNQIATFNLSSTTISTKVGDIIKVANSVIDAIFNNDIKVTKITPREEAKLRTVLNTIKDFTDQIQKLPKDIQGTVEIIKNLKLMQSVNHNALYILSYINKQTYDYNKISRSLDLLERFNEVSKDFVDINSDDVRKSKELTDNYIKYVDKINGIDLENLKTTERLFANMAKFSESINGDFDKLAESLNDRIAPLLEELKNLMSQMPGHINKASSDQQKTAIDLANNNVTQNTYKRAGMSTKEQQETTHKNEKLTQSQYDSLNNIEKIVKILEGNDVNGGVKISRSR